MKRRKELCTVITDRTIHREFSFDFEIPSGDVLVEGAEGPVDWVPLFVLRKAPSLMTQFDLCDEVGRSLPLPTRAENATVSAATLRRLAARTLLNTPGGSTVMPQDIANDLNEVASGRPEDARRIVEARFPPTPLDRTPARDREFLMASGDFTWLLNLLAEHSIVMLPFSNSRSRRRLIKLRYDEKVRFPPSRLRQLFSVFEQFGWRGYLLTLEHPFVGAGAFHFEFEAPEDLQITDAGLIVAGSGIQTATRHVRKRVHLYFQGIERGRSGLSFAQLRVRGRSFTGGAFLIAGFIAALLSCGYWQASHLAKGLENGGPSILLVFPGLVAGYIAREEHPLVTRLLSFARRLLLITALLSLASAARLVLVTPARTTTTYALEMWFGISAIIAWVAVGGLYLTRHLPLPLTSRFRRGTRLNV